MSLCLGFFGAVAGLSCSDDEASFPTEPRPSVCPFPLHHVSAACSAGRVAFEDYGMICIRSRCRPLYDYDLTGIWVLDVATGERNRVGPATAHGPAWSSDGSRLAWSQWFAWSWPADCSVSTGETE